MVTYVSLAVLIVLISVAIGMAMRLFRSLRQYRIPQRYSAGSDAPSVSVCIPARNEMHALADCLERVLASTYQKLEILVYDDDLQDETPTIIRSFAHDGVRFVGGERLPEGWIGKNYALETLAREASGTFVIFMDVDTSIRPTTIGELVEFAIAEDVDMVSVLPRREDMGRANVWFGMLRYFWQLVGLGSARVAVSSSLWLMKRDILLNRGGFEAQKSSVEPEADVAFLLGSRYRYLTGLGEIGVSFEKRWRSQIDTGRRLLFSLFGVKGLLILVLLNIPTAVVVYGALFGWNVIATIAVAIWFLFIAVYALYLRVAWSRYWVFGALLWPYVVLQELVVMVMSAWGYARGTIKWKQRSVQLRR